MRVEVDFEGGKNAAGIYVHKRLPEAMGNSVAGFAHAVLSGHSQPGVWYPEEKEALAVSGLCGWVCGWCEGVRLTALAACVCNAWAVRV